MKGQDLGKPERFLFAIFPLLTVFPSWVHFKPFSSRCFCPFPSLLGILLVTARHWGKFAVNLSILMWYTDLSRGTWNLKEKSRETIHKSRAYISGWGIRGNFWAWRCSYVPEFRLYEPPNDAVLWKSSLLETPAGDLPPLWVSLFKLERQGPGARGRTGTVAYSTLVSLSVHLLLISSPICQFLF